MKRIILGFAILMLLLLPLRGYAVPGPMETVREDAQKVLEVLRDQNMTEEAKKEKLREYYRQMIDQVEFARRSLGPYWSKLTPEQQQEFIQLYRQLLEKAYADRIFSFDYTNAKVVVSKETMLSQNRAEVRTKSITPSGKEIAVTYRLILKDDGWRVYDVVIENVSLVQNYRSQFNAILAKNTPDQMLEILKNKVKGA